MLAMTLFSISVEGIPALPLPCVFLPTPAPYALAVAIVLLAPEKASFFRLKTFAP
jgi:hypothetical protein